MKTNRTLATGTYTLENSRDDRREGGFQCVTWGYGAGNGREAQWKGAASTSARFSPSAIRPCVTDRSRLGSCVESTAVGGAHFFLLLDLSEKSCLSSAAATPYAARPT